MDTGLNSNHVNHRHVQICDAPCGDKDRLHHTQHQSRFNQRAARTMQGAAMKAFPNNRSEGMDLRDYFAAKAMQGLVKVAFAENVPKENVVKTAYKIADAMMKAREVNDD